jgi:hypothetical protein
MSNLLQKASIITTPTAYDTGKILSVKPVQYYGPELVTNGDFATDSDWFKSSFWTISGGAASMPSTNSYLPLYQNDVTISGKTYVLNFDIVSIIGTIKATSLNNGAASGEITLGEYSTIGNKKITFTTQSGGESIAFARVVGVTASCTIDNVSVKEVINADFDFERNSSATRVGSNGLIQDVASNIPRIDYTGGVGSWKFEPQRTNLINYSESISNTPIKSGTYTDNFAISPDGTLNATKVTATSADPYFYQNISYSAASYTASIYIKGIGNSVGKSFQIRLASNIYTDTIPLEWTRFEYTVTMPSGSSNVGVEIPNPAVVGDEVLVWGWQLEEGSYSTSYIPTSGEIGGVTRLADVANNAGSSDLINSTEGVLYAEISALADTQQNRFVGINDGSNSNRVVIGYTSVGSNTPRVIVTSGGSTQAAIDFNINDIRQEIKIAAKYKLNSVDLWLNGFKVGSDTSAAMPIGLNNLSFDSDGSGNSDFYGNTKSVAVFKEALTDLELECLVSWMSFSDMGIALGYTVE